MPALHPLVAEKDVVVALVLAGLLEHAVAISATAANAAAVVETLRSVVNLVSPFRGVRLAGEDALAAADPARE
jgi:hypothetical protein